MNWVLFTVVITLFVLARLMSLYPIVFSDACFEKMAYFKSEWNFQTPPNELFAIAACLIIALQAIWAAHSYPIRDFKNFAIGALNIIAACGIIAYSAVGWAFFNPTNQVSEGVNRWGPRTGHFFPLVYDDIYLHWQDDFFAASPNWEHTGNKEYYNSERSVIARYQIIRSCKTTNRVRVNFETRFPDREFQSEKYNVSGWVYFDADGRLIGRRNLTFDREHSAVIEQLPSPDWRTPDSQYRELLDDIVFEMSGKDKLSSAEAVIQMLENESGPE